MQLAVTHEGEPTAKRRVKINPDYQVPNITPEEEQEEEKLMDEQKLFQTLHENLIELQKQYGKTTEQMSELFLRVCGDLQAVEAALQGRTSDYVEWNYLEDLALTKPQESTEYQWLFKLKGQSEIEKRRKFLLTSDGKDDEPEINENEPGFKQETMDEDVQMKEEKHELVAEAVGYI